ncbi:ABC transporter permease [Mesobacterium pallidum]|uniref:ABC transporter permease n=1 Tax=Mesobacterium pallidum TaxID=2872037 RepID=UPI001EE16872|nr:ABC transporter permease [Mesobacterium pallidum]
MRSLRRILAILRKELLQLRRDRTTFGMVVMIPLIQLMLFGYAINTNVRNIPVALVDQAQTGLSRALVQMVEATQVVTFTEQHATYQEAEAGLVAGRTRAVLVIPSDVDSRLVRSPAVFPTSGTGPDRSVDRPVAQWVVDGSDTLVAASIRSLRTMPLTELFRQAPNAQTPTFATTLLFNPEQRSVVNIVPGLVGMILTMTMVMFTSAAIVREKELGNMEMLINTPIRPLELMLGKILPYVVIGLVQAAIILGLGHLVFDVPINGAALVIFAVTLCFILASLVLGLIISTIASNQLQAMQMTVFVLLPSILLSGFMFPFEGMPEIAQHIASALPATHFVRAIRGVVLRDAGLAELAPDILWLCLFTLAGLVLAALRFRKRLG